MDNQRNNRYDEGTDNRRTGAQPHRSAAQPGAYSETRRRPVSSGANGEIRRRSAQPDPYAENRRRSAAPGESSEARRRPAESGMNGETRRRTAPSGTRPEGQRHRPDSGAYPEHRRAAGTPDTRRRTSGRRRRKPARKHYYVPGWLFVAVIAVADELILHFWTATDFVFGRFLAVLIFALAFGSLLSFVTALFPPKGQKRCAVTITSVLAVLYLLEYFLTDAYQTFMSFGTIFAGAGGVAKDYFTLVMTMLLKNLWRIALIFLPVVLFGLYGRCRKVQWNLRSCLGAGALTLYLLGFCMVQWVGIDAANFSSAYNFDSAVRSFGLNVGLALDAVKSNSTEDNPGFVHSPDQQGQESRPQQGGDPTSESTAETRPEIPTGPNVLPLDFTALANQESNSAVASIHSYVAGLIPSQKNAYTGLFKGKNLILITAEAFSAEAIDKDLTPTLYRLANEGIKFTDYYQPAWGASTIGGEYSNIVGLMPTTGAECMKEAAQQDLFMTMGSRLRDLGYYSIAYHNHDYTYYGRDQTHTHIGYDQFIGRGNGMENYLTKAWPESDLEMMQYTVPQYIDHQPFSIYYMTVSGHALYSRKGNSMSAKNYDKVKDLSCSETVKCYLASQLELEYAMESLVSQLEAAGIADDTVIVMTADHYPYGLEKSSTWGNSQDYLSELFGKESNTCFVRDHSALIIWSGCLEGKNIQVDTPVFSLDILPTLSNLFGVDYDSRLLPGRDVFSEKQPLVFWPNKSWKTDKGTYNASKGTFTPAEGVEVDDDYVGYITSLVKNKITYCSSVAKTDYFNYLVEPLKNGVG